MAIRFYSGLILALPLMAQQNLSSPVSVLPSAPGTTGGEVRFWNAAHTHWQEFTGGPGGTANITWVLPPTDSTGTQFLASNGSGVLSWQTAGSGTVCGSNTQVIFNNSGACGASPNFTWQNTPQSLTVTGIASTPSIISAGGFMQSIGGYLSTANNWEAFQSLTDGSLLRGYHVDHPDPSSGAPQYTGGYIAIAPINYIPTGGAAYPPGDPRNCYDQYANLVSQPIPLNGLGSFANTNVLLWNSPSPLQGYLGGSPYHIDGTPCGSPLPLPVYNGISNNTGLNTNAYVLAMGGFATPINSAQAVQIWFGGVTALDYFAGAFYPAGTVTTTGTLSSAQYLGGFMAMGHANQVPGNGTLCTSIASCTNPTPPGFGTIQGEFYWDDALGGMNTYDGTAWHLMAQQTKNVTFSEITTTNTTGSCINYQIASFEFQVDCHGNVSMSGASSGHGVLTVNGAFGGINVATNTGFNSIQTAGGFLSNVASPNQAFATANSNVIINADGTASFGNVVNSNGATGGFNVTADTAINSIQTVGGFQSRLNGTANCAIIFHDSMSINQGCVAADLLIGMGQNGHGGNIRVSDGSGAGGLDSAGAQILLVANNGSSNGLITSNGTVYNSVQVPTGGIYVGLGLTTDQALYPKGASACTSLNSPASLYGGFGYNTGSKYCYWNGSAWTLFDFTAFTNYWTLSGPNLYNNSGSFVIAGGTTDDGSHAALQSDSSLSVTGLIIGANGTTGTNITFENANNHFSVDVAGDITGAGVIHMTGTTSPDWFLGDTIAGATGLLDYTGSAGRNLQVTNTVANNWVAFRMSTDAGNSAGYGAYMEFASTDAGITGDHRMAEEQFYRTTDVTAGKVTSNYVKYMNYDGTLYGAETISGNSHSITGPAAVANEVLSVIDGSGSGSGYLHLGRTGSSPAELVGIAGGDFAIDAYGVANNVLYMTNAGSQPGTLGLYQGNVGVKTLSPNWPLDVHGGNSNQIHVNGNNSGSGGFIYASNGDNNINMSGGHYFDGSNWHSTASSSGMISATGAGVFAYQNPSQSIGVAITPNLVAGFTTTGDSLYAKTTIGTGTIASQVNFNSVNPSTDSGGFLTSINDNSAWLSAGQEYNTSNQWVARSSGGATALTLSGGSGISVLINNSTTSGFAFTPTLTASFRATSFNFTGHLNGSLGIVSPTVSGSASCSLGSGSTDMRGSIVFNSTGVCNLNFAASYSTAPFCVGTPSNLNGTTYLFFGPTTTQWSISSNGTTTIYYHCVQ